MQCNTDRIFLQPQTSYPRSRSTQHLQRTIDRGVKLQSLHLYFQELLSGYLLHHTAEFGSEIDLIVLVELERVGRGTSGNISYRSDITVPYSSFSWYKSLHSYLRP